MTIATYLPHVGRLASHVRSSYNLETFSLSQQFHLIGNEGDIVLHLHAGMPTACEDQVSFTCKKNKIFQVYVSPCQEILSEF